MKGSHKMSIGMPDHNSFSTLPQSNHIQLKLSGLVLIMYFLGKKVLIA